MGARGPLGRHAPSRLMEERGDASRTRKKNKKKAGKQFNAGPAGRRDGRPIQAGRPGPGPGRAGPPFPLWRGPDMGPFSKTLGLLL